MHLSPWVRTLAAPSISNAKRGDHQSLPSSQRVPPRRRTFPRGNGGKKKFNSLHDIFQFKETKSRHAGLPLLLSINMKGENLLLRIEIWIDQCAPEGCAGCPSDRARVRGRRTDALAAKKRSPRADRGRRRILSAIRRLINSFYGPGRPMGPMGVWFIRAGVDRAAAEWGQYWAVFFLAVSFPGTGNNWML